MNTNYFRAVTYHEGEDVSAIVDSNGMFEHLWQFGTHLAQQGFKVLELSSDKAFLDGNIDKVEPNANNSIVRSHSKGKPEDTTYVHKGITYKAVKVSDKIYIPGKVRAKYSPA